MSYDINPNILNAIFGESFFGSEDSDSGHDLTRISIIREEADNVESIQELLVGAYKEGGIDFEADDKAIADIKVEEVGNKLEITAPTSFLSEFTFFNIENSLRSRIDHCFWSSEETKILLPIPSQFYQAPESLADAINGMFEFDPPAQIEGNYLLVNKMQHKQMYEQWEKAARAKADPIALDAFDRMVASSENFGLPNNPQSEPDKSITGGKIQGGVVVDLPQGPNRKNG